MFDDVHVTVCTIALDNEKLIKLLIQRRQLLLKIENMLPIGEKFDINDVRRAVRLCRRVPVWKRIICCASSAQGIHSKILKLEKQIDKLSEKIYYVTKVFISFETEEAQRKVLKAMSLPGKAKAAEILDEKFKFEGKVLEIREPDEPSAVRWFDLEDEPIVSARVNALFLFA